VREALCGRHEKWRRQTESQEIDSVSSSAEGRVSYRRSAQSHDAGVGRTLVASPVLSPLDERASPPALIRIRQAGVEGYRADFYPRAQREWVSGFFRCIPASNLHSAARALRLALLR
jgi:hypothetical protein